MLDNQTVQQITAQSVPHKPADQHIGIGKYPHWLSGNISEEILIRQITGGFRIRLQLGPDLIEIANQNMAAQRFPRQIAAGKAGALGEICQLAIQFVVEADREDAHISSPREMYDKIIHSFGLCKSVMTSEIPVRLIGLGVVEPSDGVPTFTLTH